MKKIIFSLVMAFMTICSFAQNDQSNYAGSSKFTDNWSVTLQGGVVTPFNDCFTNGSTTPTVVLGVDKYITPWLGFGVEGRTTIGVGDNYNLHTAFDAVNVSGLVKFNVNNFFDFDGNRKTFEPVVYTGLGWGHTNCSKLPLVRDYMTYRAGMELNFNLGKSKAWCVVVNPSVVWGDINNGKLVKSHGNLEVTAGIVYRFKTSNGKRSMTKAHIDDHAALMAMSERLADLETNTNAVAAVADTVTLTKVVEKVVNMPYPNMYVVTFAWNSAELTNDAKATLDEISGSVEITGYASPEGDAEHNKQLSFDRAEAVANYLANRGVNVIFTKGAGAVSPASNRLAIIHVIR